MSIRKKNNILECLFSMVCRCVDAMFVVSIVRASNEETSDANDWYM